MNTIVIDSLLNTLYKSKNLLTELNDSSYCCKEIGPYYSSVGSHVRHILDFYNCIFKGLESKHIDLTLRERNQTIERDCNCAISEIDTVASKLKDLYGADLTLLLDVEDDLGDGNITLQYTLGAILAQANGHTVHHYAIIGYIMDRLDVVIEDENFGYNPTTPKAVLKNTRVG
jgi:uncharacterized damage-inducible protein DinB